MDDCQLELRKKFNVERIASDTLNAICSDCGERLGAHAITECPIEGDGSNSALSGLLSCLNEIEKESFDLQMEAYREENDERIAMYRGRRQAVDEVAEKFKLKITVAG